TDIEDGGKNEIPQRRMEYRGEIIKGAEAGRPDQVAHPETHERRPCKYQLRRAERRHLVIKPFQSVDPRRNIKGDEEEIRPDFAESFSAPRENSPCLERSSPLPAKNPFIDKQQAGKYQRGLFLQHGESKQDQGNDFPFQRTRSLNARL